MVVVDGMAPIGGDGKADVAITTAEELELNDLSSVLLSAES
jgi:hypothetical protein